MFNNLFRIVIGAALWMTVVASSHAASLVAGLTNFTSGVNSFDVTTAEGVVFRFSNPISSYTSNGTGGVGAWSPLIAGMADNTFLNTSDMLAPGSGGLFFGNYDQTFGAVVNEEYSLTQFDMTVFTVPVGLVSSALSQFGYLFVGDFSETGGGSHLFSISGPGVASAGNAILGSDSLFTPVGGLFPISQGDVFRFTYTGSALADNRQSYASLTGVAGVPEPSTVFGSAVGALLGFVGFVRRRKVQSATAS